MFRILFILAMLALSGCQQSSIKKQNGSLPVNVPQNPMTASQWLNTHSEIYFSDAVLDADEVSYVLRKVGFDPAISEIVPWIGKPRSALIDYLMASLTTQPVLQPPSWTSESVRYWGQGNWPESRRAAFRSSRQQEVGQFRQWWTAQMLSTPSPMGERMVLFWENTFVAGFSGLDQRSHAQWYHHETIRKHALGNYADLIGAMVRDPAILTYLDNNQNRKDAPNENFARELLELFTLGEANYTESDIKNSARALAGWHVSEFGDLSFERSAWAEDRGIKTIFGQRGRFNGDDMAQLILSQPAASRHLATRLWNEFVSHDVPPKEVVDVWAESLIATGYNIGQFLEVILKTEYFWDPVYRGTSVKSPVELVVGVARSSQLDHLSLQQIDAALSAMGQTLFDPPDVSGWGYGEYWLDPSFLIERDQFLGQFLNSKQSMKSNESEAPDQGKLLKVKLAGEAYNGPPDYQVTVFYDGGKRWRSERSHVSVARDTQRLGRYKDESEWIWETVQFALPEDLNNIEDIQIKFAYDAAGNGGDRNLFIGGVEWLGNSVPGTAGTQSPGCGGDPEGKRRHPDRLYCSGTVSFDWPELLAARKQMNRNHKNVSYAPEDMVTRELVLEWITPPSQGGYQDISVMFDGLSFEGREWDFFGFSLSKDKKGRYRINFNERRCSPSCFSTWPFKAWKDKAGVKHVSVPLNAYDNWSYEQYRGLKSDDKRLVKALFTLVGDVEKKVIGSPIHREPDSEAIWLERLQKFKKAANSRRFRSDKTIDLIEVRSGDSVNMMAMSMMQGAMDNTEHYVFPSGSLPSVTRWMDQVSNYPLLMADGMQGWMLSIDSGNNIYNLQDWLDDPAINLK